MSDKILNLTVIGDCTCSTTRTYLTYLRRAGYRVQRLWLADFGPENRRRRLLRQFLGRTLSSMLTGQPKLSLSFDPADAEYTDLCLRLQEEAGLEPIDYFSEWDPEAFAEETVTFRARDFTDRSLHARMEGARDTAFLYTNGGIVPAALLETPGIRVFHIHPGIVPDLRGSDCLLWSAAVRRKLGVSCFYMSPGIDEGALIGQVEFVLPRLPSLTPLMSAEKEPLAYRALLFAVDPHLRAKLFVDVLTRHPGADLRALPAETQAMAPRLAYLWMHPRLRLQTMREAFL